MLAHSMTESKYKDKNSWQSVQTDKKERERVLIHVWWQLTFCVDLWANIVRKSNDTRNKSDESRQSVRAFSVIESNDTRMIIADNMFWLTV